MDESIYKVLAPKLLQELVSTSSLRKIKAAKTLSFGGLNCGAVSRFVAALGLLAAAVPLLILPQRQDLYAAGNALCGGELDFAFTLADRSDSFPVVWANTEATPTHAQTDDLRWDRPPNELGEMPFMGKFVNALLNGHGKEACDQAQCSSDPKHHLPGWGYPMCCWANGPPRYNHTRELRQVQTEQIDRDAEQCADKLDYEDLRLSYPRAQYVCMHACMHYSSVHVCASTDTCIQLSPMLWLLPPKSLVAAMTVLGRSVRRQQSQRHSHSCLGLPTTAMLGRSARRLGATLQVSIATLRTRRRMQLLGDELHG